MARFTTITSVVVGASGLDLDFDIAIPTNNINIGKVKIVPSGSDLGYYFQIFKQGSRLIGIGSSLQLASKNPIIGNCYIPTDRNGNEVLQGWVLPYEDLDSSFNIFSGDRISNIHCRLHNFDSVSRTFAVSIDYEVRSVLASDLASFALVNFGSVVQTLPETPIAGSVKVYRGGLRQTSGISSLLGTNITLATPLMVGEECIADYIRA